MGLNRDRLLGAALRSLRVSTFGQPLALIVAERRGLLSARGLHLEHQQTSGSREQMEQLVAGHWDVVHTAVDNVIAAVDEQDADVFVCIVLHADLSQTLMLRPGISTYDDLRGATVGVDAPTAGYALVLREMLHRNGIGVDDYSVQPVGGTALRAHALASGEIDATLLSSPHDRIAVEAKCSVLDEASRYFPDYPRVTAATTRRRARQDDAVMRYCHALIEAERWLSAPENRDEALELISDARGVSTEVAAHQLRDECRRPVRSLRDVERAIGTVASLRARELGSRGSPGGISDYFDPSFMLPAFGLNTGDGLS